jgi:hypothetical protein
MPQQESYSKKNVETILTQIFILKWQWSENLVGEAKKSKRNEAKWSEKIGPLFSLEHAKTKRNGSSFASFRFEAKKYFMRNRRTLILR